MSCEPQFLSSIYLPDAVKAMPPSSWVLLQALQNVHAVSDVPLSPRNPSLVFRY